MIIAPHITTAERIAALERQITAHPACQSIQHWPAEKRYRLEMAHGGAEVHYVDDMTQYAALLQLLGHVGHL